MLILVILGTVLFLGSLSGARYRRRAAQRAATRRQRRAAAPKPVPAGREMPWEEEVPIDGLPFFSYHHADRVDAKNLHAAVQAAGTEMGMVVWNLAEEGPELAAALRGLIDRADRCLVTFGGNHEGYSAWVSYEVRTAMTLGFPVIVVEDHAPHARSPDRMSGLSPHVRDAVTAAGHLHVDRRVLGEATPRVVAAMARVLRRTRTRGNQVDRRGLLITLALVLGGIVAAAMASAVPRGADAPLLLPGLATVGIGLLGWGVYLVLVKPFVGLARAKRPPRHEVPGIRRIIDVRRLPSGWAYVRGLLLSGLVPWTAAATRPIDARGRMVALLNLDRAYRAGIRVRSQER